MFVNIILFPFSFLSFDYKNEKRSVQSLNFKIFSLIKSLIYILNQRLIERKFMLGYTTPKFKKNKE